MENDVISSSSDRSPSIEDPSLPPDDKEKQKQNAPKNTEGDAVSEKTSQASSESKSPKKAPSRSSSSASKGSGDKVKVHFVAVGSAPLMKKTKFQIGGDQRFAAVVAFLRKMLKLGGTGDSLFLYCNAAFVPSPDELVGDLNDCFSVRGELVIHYSLQEAWG